MGWGAWLRSTAAPPSWGAAGWGVRPCGAAACEVWGAVLLGAPRQGPSRHSCPPSLAAPTVSLPELRSLLAAGRARLVDVRSREEAAAGTIPGALNIPGTGLGGGAATWWTQGS